MKKEVAEAWVADLRSNPPQAMRTLYDGHGHCCLGRLCVILGKKFEKGEDSNEVNSLSLWYPVLSNGNRAEWAGNIPEEVRIEAGMASNDGYLGYGNSNRGDTLALLNDRGESFNAIADVIEKNWEIL